MAAFRRFFSAVHKSTIFALSSGQGKCGVSILRVSGPKAGEALKVLTNSQVLPKPRFAHLKSIRHPRSCEILDKGLILWFPGPNSFTGEDSCEFQVHGSLAVINGVIDALASIPTLRLAEPGEFARRAFYNGKLDLTEIEGLADLIHAETEVQRKQAFLQSQGSLSLIYKNWKQELSKCLAHVEASIDFEETDDVDLNELIIVKDKINMLHETMLKHLKNGERGEIIRNGVNAVIIGEPNVGKSSFFNLICGRPAAIVTPLPGTTRDLLEIKLDISGYPVLLRDTAGLRSETSDVIEQEGISRALQSCKEADLLILIIDVVKYTEWIKENPAKTFNDYICHYLSSMGLGRFLNKTGDEMITKSPCIIIVNKIDLVDKDRLSVQDVVKMSCKNNIGLEECLGEMINKLKLICGEPSREHPSMNQIRHRQHITDCLTELETFLKKLPSTGDNFTYDLAILTEHLRRSLRHLGKLVGTVTNEELLDIIFKDFCIGK